MATWVGVFVSNIDRKSVKMLEVEASDEVTATVLLDFYDYDAILQHYSLVDVRKKHVGILKALIPQIQILLAFFRRIKKLINHVFKTSWLYSSPDRIQIAARSSFDRKASRRFKVSKKWLIYGGLGLLSLVLVITLGPVISHPIERAISLVENQYQQWFDQQDTANPLVLLPLAFIGGLLASISPCILALLPVNLSYIGTLNIKSRWNAFTKAGLFVLGAVTILSLFGLVSSFAGAVMVEYRGYINTDRS
jgi:hypothetical protein